MNGGYGSPALVDTIIDRNAQEFPHEFMPESKQIRTLAMIAATALLVIVALKYAVGKA